MADHGYQNILLVTFVKKQGKEHYDHLVNRLDAIETRVSCVENAMS